ncbi:MAG TPA: methyltransferase domain-containing protein [Candidatus Binatia bacterium]
MKTERTEFWSKVAAKYDRVVDLQIGPQTRSLLRERLRKEGQLGDVAEFGCGTGYYTQVLSEKATSVIATDLAPGMLEIAKERVKAANINSRPKTATAPRFLPPRSLGTSNSH